MQCSKLGAVGNISEIVEFPKDRFETIITWEIDLRHIFTSEIDLEVY